MALMALVAFGPHDLDLDLDFKKNVKSERRSFDLKFNNGSYEHTYDNYDAFTPDYILLKCENTNILESFDSSKSRFKLELGDVTVVDASLDFFAKYNDPIIDKNTLCIKIPFELYTNEIYKISLKDINVKCSVRLESFADELFDIKVSNTLLYYDTTPRNRIALCPFRQIIQQVSSHTINMQNKRSFDERISTFNYIKGYILDGDIENLTDFRLKINGQKYIDYDKFGLEIYGKKIGKNLLYISLNPDIKINDINNRSQDMVKFGINDDRIDTAEYQASFSEPQNIFTIHFVSAHVFTYAGHMSKINQSVDGQYQTAVFCDDELAEKTFNSYKEKLSGNFKALQELDTLYNKNKVSDTFEKIGEYNLDIKSKEDQKKHKLMQHKMNEVYDALDDPNSRQKEFQTLVDNIKTEILDVNFIDKFANKFVAETNFALDSVKKNKLPFIHKRLLCKNMIIHGTCKLETGCNFAHSLKDQVLDQKRSAVYTLYNQKDLSSTNLKQNKSIYDELKVMTKLCGNCVDGTCFGGHNCKYGTYNKKLQVCEEDLDYGYCINRHCKLKHLSHKGLKPYYSS